MNTMTLRVNDALSEADSLAEFHQLREEQVQQQHLLEEEIKEALDSTLSESRRL